MSAPLCPDHSLPARAFVCQHIPDGLIRRERVGFCWTSDDPGNPHPDAWCSACEARRNRTGGAWVGEALKHLQAKLMCANCYALAKEFHQGGDPWKESARRPSASALDRIRKVLSRHEAP
jgi:hypothetical protein